MRKTNLLLVLLLAFSIQALTACDLVISTETPAPVELTPTSTPKLETPEPQEPSILDEIVVERTPVPTAQPGPIQEEVERIVVRAGLSRMRVLGLNVTDWVDLFLSFIYVLIGYQAGTFLVKKAFKKVENRALQGLDLEYVQKMGADLRLIVVLLVIYLSIRRLNFLSTLFMTILVDVSFSIGTFLVYRLVMSLIHLAEAWYRNKSKEENREEELLPVITLLERLSRVIVALIFTTIFLSHFGINVTAFAAALGIGGLAISLAARDTIADAIAGFIILVDRPFRIGDRIEIQGVDTWGDVADIGLRTTRIRTRDNRMVIVPNSMIGSNRVINYSYPDPQYRIETHVGVAYGTDIEKARALMIDTVRNLADVLKDKPVDALYHEMGDHAMIFRIRWWIESYADTRRVLDRVNTALQNALDTAGIDSPLPTQNIHLEFNSDMVGQLAQPSQESQHVESDHKASKNVFGP